MRNQWVGDMKSRDSKKSGPGLARSAAMSSVYVALMKDRWNLRRAARHAGDPKLKRVLRRMAFRKARDAEALADSTKLDAAGLSAMNSAETFTRDIVRANEIGTVASCLRSNRKLRISIERALATSPPDRLQRRLEKLRDSASSEAGLLEARLRDIAIQGFPQSPPIAD